MFDKEYYTNDPKPVGPKNHIIKEGFIRNKFNEGYALGWNEARDMTNWEMRSLLDENSRLKLEKTQLKVDNLKNKLALDNISRILI